MLTLKGMQVLYNLFVEGAALRCQEGITVLDGGRAGSWTEAHCCLTTQPPTQPLLLSIY